MAPRGPPKLTLYVPPRFPDEDAVAYYLDERTGNEWEEALPANESRVEAHLAQFLE